MAPGVEVARGRADLLRRAFGDRSARRDTLEAYGHVYALLTQI
jgi:hypothetical protein